jgi:hypothetical protein
MRTNEMTGPMRKVEDKLGEPLKDWLAAQYASGTLDDVTAALAGEGITVDRTTVAGWMDRLGIDRRFPGQRPDMPKAIA